MNKLLVMLLIVGLTACSNRAVYENIRIHQTNECLKVPPARYGECLESVNKPYDEYERERKEILEN